MPDIGVAVTLAVLATALAAPGDTTVFHNVGSEESLRKPANQTRARMACKDVLIADDPYQHKGTQLQQQRFVQQLRIQ